MRVDVGPEVRRGMEWIGAVKACFSPGDSCYNKVLGCEPLAADHRESVNACEGQISRGNYYAR